MRVEAEGEVLVDGVEPHADARAHVVVAAGEGAKVPGELDAAARVQIHPRLRRGVVQRPAPLPDGLDVVLQAASDVLAVVPPPAAVKVVAAGVLRQVRECGRGQAHLLGPRLVVLHAAEHGLGERLAVHGGPALGGRQVVPLAALVDVRVVAETAHPAVQVEPPQVLQLAVLRVLGQQLFAVRQLAVQLRGVGARKRRHARLGALHHTCSVGCGGQRTGGRAQRRAAAAEACRTLLGVASQPPLEEGSLIGGSQISPPRILARQVQSQRRQRPQGPLVGW